MIFVLFIAIIILVELCQLNICCSRRKPMRLRDLDVPPVFNASGALGFFGEGYWFHSFLRALGLTYDGAGFTAKTTTMQARLDPDKDLGNMRLKKDGLTPQDWLPDCIKVNFRHPWVLNAVGLSGPGAPVLFSLNRWQRMRDFKLISFMSIEPTKADRLAETSEFVGLAEREMQEVPLWGLEINFSCPNTEVNPHDLLDEVGETFDITAGLDVPQQAKFSPIAPVETVIEACARSTCDAVVVGNTVKFNDLPNEIRSTLFGNRSSPLAKYGGGGLSGPMITPMVCEWIKAARGLDFTKPIWAGNGLYSCRLIKQAADAGASGIHLGCAGILRPHRIKRLINFAHETFSS